MNKRRLVLIRISHVILLTQHFGLTQLTHTPLKRLQFVRVRVLFGFLCIKQIFVCMHVYVSVCSQLQMDVFGLEKQLFCDGI